MKPGIHFSKIWFDDDLVELRITACDGTSLFSNTVYAGYASLAEIASNLDVFKDQTHGGLLDVALGAFGPEYANGAFHARLQFPRPGRLHITCRQESDFEDFAKKTVASHATLYLQSEPALLDQFLSQFHALATSTSDEAYLEGICP